MRAFDLSGRTALVTGASAGLGRHFAATLAAAGARVVLGARRPAELEAAAAEIAAAGGVALALPLDVADDGSVRSTVAAALERFGRLDVLINNAGVTVAEPALELAEQDWDRVLATNLKGAWLMSRAVGRAMRQDGHGGSIVNIASILGLRVAGNLAAYAASKAGLIQLTRSMALELARHAIRVNAIAPGYIETGLNRKFFAGEAGQALINRIPQRRLGRPEELDGALLLLASDASSYMTGSVITVDGGHLQSSL